METSSGPLGEGFGLRGSSMDQFRGYTVAGMFVVNFVGGLAAFPEVLKHHNGLPYFSYADTIMPSFMFAAGFSYRLSALKRFRARADFRAYRHFVVRSLALGADLAGDVRGRRCRVQEMVADDWSRPVRAVGGSLGCC